ncbi:MAG TPA: NADH-quinone oxidoreductase subunit L [Planctomycetaceae bacterium]|nr:NADH-quinone oxidoreductase subunit L [Planctomycetaceae bacterium]
MSATWLPPLLIAAWLLPLAGFAVEIFGGYWQRSRFDRRPAYLAVGCIGLGFVLSLAALVIWGLDTNWAALSAGEHHAASEHGAAAHTAGEPAPGDDAAAHDAADAEHRPPHAPVSGTIYTLGEFGSLRVSLDYYIDSLTLVMFAMVTLIATCIHVFALGYMSDELTDTYVDHHAHTRHGHLHRPGRYYLFFAYMSLFCFSMLGLVIAGNIFHVFVFWELVGICSYLLIGFYYERHTASTAANKAFIMNRVGDFGFLIGLMVLWTWFGTFSFGEQTVGGRTTPGLFAMVRGDDGQLDVAIDESGTKVVRLRETAAGAPAGAADADEAAAGAPSSRTIPYWLLAVAGLGVFAGCVGKSAQFPLQTWLPDAMEGPTPVSALVHSATMVAAGVYLAGRFFPMFTPEVLLVIAYIGCVTLFVAATIAVVATDIKRVLAYSTISQLGYMMLAIGIGGWVAGLFHLVTHAFFKSLMFLCSGSVIVGCHHEQDMTRMGGLRRKMPVTAYTMLVGVIAISGLAIPGTFIAFSGYYSKDAIVATGLAFNQTNPTHFLLFLVPLVTAGITAFYMFRLWFYTFCGEPRDRDLYDHVHESPRVMTAPLVVLAVFAAVCTIGWANGPVWGEKGWLYLLLLNSEPAGLAAGTEAIVATGAAALTGSTIGLPSHAAIHEVHAAAGAFALIAAAAGTLLAFLLYVVRVVDPAEIKRQVRGLHQFLADKWQFDTMYDVAFVRPVHRVAAWCAWIDRAIIDGFLHWCSRTAVRLARWNRQLDDRGVDRLVNVVGDAVFATGRSLRRVQTGLLRQYIVFIALGVVSLFVLAFVLFPK